MIARRRVLRAALGLAPWALAGCERRSTVMDLVKLVPPNAQVLQDRGAFELALQQCEIDVLLLLGAKAGRHPELERYRVPSSTTWEAVNDFYAAHLSAPWQRSTDVPEQHTGFRLRLWQRTGLLGTQRVAVALLDLPAVGMESTTPFRMLVVASEGG